MTIFSKWRLLGLFWIVQTMALYLGGAAWQVLGESVDNDKGRFFGRLTWQSLSGMLASPYFLSWTLPIIGAMTLLQWVLVSPVRRPRPRREHGHALWLSMGVAGVGVTGLVTGLALAVVNGIELATRLRPTDWPARTIGLWGTLIVWCGVCWVIATPLLIAFCKRRINAGERWEEVLRVVAARLFVGTIIEVAAIMPLDVLVRRKESCYCWAGTFFALTISGAIGVVLLGPLVLLPALSRRRKRWYGGHCDCCGYDLSGLMSRGGAERRVDRCPECGAGWRVERTPEQLVVD